MGRRWHYVSRLDRYTIQTAVVSVGLSESRRDQNWNISSFDYQMIWYGSGRTRFIEGTVFCVPVVYDMFRYGFIANIMLKTLKKQLKTTFLSRLLGCFFLNDILIEFPIYMGSETVWKYCTLNVMALNFRLSRCLLRKEIAQSSADRGHKGQ